MLQKQRKSAMIKMYWKKKYIDKGYDISIVF